MFFAPAIFTFMPQTGSMAMSGSRRGRGVAMGVRHACHVYPTGVWFKSWTSKLKKSQLARLSRIEGQVRGVARMIEEDRYCIDVLTQIRAVRAALDKVEQETLSDHLQHCVAHAFHAGSERTARSRSTSCSKCSTAGGADMIRLRSLLWLIALVSLASPSMGSWAAVQPAMEHAAMTDCSGHGAPSPDEHRSKDMAKHNAAECCAFMCVGMALMPADTVPPITLPAEAREAAPTHDLAGRHPAKDPPPPRA